MPSTYAHYKFGKRVWRCLDEDLKKMIREHRKLFFIGLHGPDILFYNGALGKNPVNRFGFAMHDKDAAPFFEAGKEVILKSKNKEASLAYMLGFICHFMLDSETHTYVEYQIRKTGISHSELETELDRSLMEADGLNPLKEDPVKHITHEPETVKVIREFFPDFTEEDIDKTLKDMIFYLRALQATSDVKRAVIKGVLRFTGHYEGMHGLVMEKKVCPLTVESTAQLVKKLNQAVEPTARMIKDYAQYCEEDREINPRFHRTFGVDEAELAEYEKK